MSVSFSSTNRKTWIAEINNHSVDVLVIGGGLSGAGIALDASLRGLETILVEKTDFANGASGRSSKLFHGGLRHLNQFDVKKSSVLMSERAILHENAPHVARPEQMLIPIYKEGLFNRFKTSINLKMFDHLTDVKKSERGELLSKKQTLKNEPLINNERLKGSGLYTEYRINDMRLTIEVIKEAVNRGTKAVNYMKVESFLYEKGQAVGVIAVDVLSGEAIKIYAKKIVNATGAWLDELREQDRSKNDQILKYVKGVHLVINKETLPLKYGIYFKAKEGDTFIYAVPFYDKVFVGIAESSWAGDLENIKWSNMERQFLLDNLNVMFPQTKITKKDVISSWTGISSYINSPNKAPKKSEIYDDIIVSDSGLISVLLGTLTGYRMMAEKVVDMLCKELKINQRSVTDSITLTGGYVGGSELFAGFCERKVEEGKRLGLSEKRARTLVERYGSNVGNIYAKLSNKSRFAGKWGLPSDLYAELKYSLEEELVIVPEDFIIRRTGALYFEREFIEEYYSQILAYFAEHSHWTNEQLQYYTDSLQTQLKEVQFAAEDLELE
ncbi:FAD-dependent oxidoreductase [Alkalihalobacillus sp. 1P02AB]|uniref:glycerol-3-phosphate dehydrogenase/oxidase n=1 Tax=Alkalihalobacillus sp. 1P02AB TaxID=3132260 RepID=UPI0039A5CB34